MVQLFTAETISQVASGVTSEVESGTGYIVSPQHLATTCSVRSMLCDNCIDIGLKNGDMTDSTNTI